MKTLSPYQTENFAKYLNFDLWTIDLASFLLVGEVPSDEQWSWSDADKAHKLIHKMALASVLAGNIKGQGDGINFSTTPINWIEWAITKNIEIPRVFLEEREKLVMKEMNNLRADKSYRPICENCYKTAIVAAMQIIHDIIPDLPLTQLIRLQPIEELVQKNYRLETLLNWAKEAGIEPPKVGRPKKEAIEKCKQLIPEKWNHEW